MNNVYKSSSAFETMKIAEEIGKDAQKNQIYCLSGELGAGKTAFTQGFAKGLGISTPITSPTFTIINEYLEGRLPLYHFDTYRISSPEEMEDCGYEEYFYSGDGVCVIEWAELISDIIPPDAVWIRIEKVMEQGEDFRNIYVGGNKK